MSWRSRLSSLPSSALPALRRLRRVRPDLLGLAGAACVVQGVALWSTAAAWCVAGSLLLTGAWIDARAESAEPTEDRS